jgi:hypothetical protein
MNLQALTGMSSACEDALTALMREVANIEHPIIHSREIKVLCAGRSTLFVVELNFVETLAPDTLWPYDGLDIDAVFMQWCRIPNLHPPYACMPSRHLNAQRDSEYNSISLAVCFREAEASRLAQTASLN